MHRHSSGRYYSYCKECNKVRNRKYNQAYAERNREEINRKARERVASLKDDTDFREARRRYARERRARNPEMVRQKFREYKKRNPERFAYHEAIRRARKKQAVGSFTLEEWLAVCRYYRGMCLCCKRTDRPLTIDHIVPLSRGGSNYISNIQPLCKECNSVKGAKEVDYR